METLLYIKYLTYIIYIIIWSIARYIIYLLCKKNTKRTFLSKQKVWKLSYHINAISNKVIYLFLRDLDLIRGYHLYNTLCSIYSFEFERLYHQLFLVYLVHTDFNNSLTDGSRILLRLIILVSDLNILFVNIAHITKLLKRDWYIYMFIPSTFFYIWNRFFVWPFYIILYRPYIIPFLSLSIIIGISSSYKQLKLLQRYFKYYKSIYLFLFILFTFCNYNLLSCPGLIIS